MTINICYVRYIESYTDTIRKVDRWTDGRTDGMMFQGPKLNVPMKKEETKKRKNKK
jgi:hypothetical protein